MSVKLDQISTRDAFGRALAALARENGEVFYLAADTLKSMGGAPIHAEFPKRAVNVGIAEQNMVLMGAGMAAAGAKVFVATYAAFASMRVCEQIRTFIAYPKLDVKIVAGLGGLSGGIEGVTHQGTEDIGIMRTIPNLCVVAPADAASTEAITRAVGAYRGPVYLRLGRGLSPTVFDGSYTFEIGKANPLWDSGDGVALLCYGATVSRCLRAARELERRGVGARVVEFPCIKPLDTGLLDSLTRQVPWIVTVEDHQEVGGLGSAVAEYLVGRAGRARLARIGLRGFAQSGECEELLDHYGFAPEAIAQKVESLLRGDGGME